MTTADVNFPVPPGFTLVDPDIPISPDIPIPELSDDIYEYHYKGDASASSSPSEPTSTLDVDSTLGDLLHDHNLGKIFFNQYNKTKNVIYLHKAIIADEWILFSEKDQGRYHQMPSQMYPFFDTLDLHQPPPRPIGPRDHILTRLSWMYACLYTHSENTSHLSRALNNLSGVVKIPSGSVRWGVDTEIPSGTIRSNENKFERHCTICAEPDEFLLNIVEQTLAVQHMLWKASGDYEIVRKVLDAAEYWLRLTLALAAKGSELTIEENPIIVKRYDILARSIGWARDAQPGGRSTGASDYLGGLSLMLVGLTTRTEFRNSVLPRIEPEGAFMIGKSQLNRYELVSANAADAGSCLWLGMTCLNSAMRGAKPGTTLETESKELYSRLNVYYRMRFGRDYTEADNHPECGTDSLNHHPEGNTGSTDHHRCNADLADDHLEGNKNSAGVSSGNLQDTAMRAFTKYKFAHSSLAYTTIEDGVTTTINDPSTDPEIRKKTRKELLDFAIKTCVESLRQGRALILEKHTQDSQLGLMPVLHQWVQHLGEMLLAKIQRCIEDRELDELEETRIIVKNEVEENSHDVVFKLMPLARTYSLLVEAKILNALYRQDPDSKASDFRLAITKAKQVLEIGKRGIKITEGFQYTYSAVLEQARAHAALGELYLGEFERSGKVQYLDMAASEMKKSLRIQTRYMGQSQRGWNGTRGGDLQLQGGIEPLLEYVKSQNTFAAILTQRYRARGASEDLRDAIERQRMAVVHSVPNRELRARFQLTLCKYLEMYYQESIAPFKSSREELKQIVDEVLDHCRQALGILEGSGDYIATFECIYIQGSMLIVGWESSILTMEAIANARLAPNDEYSLQIRVAQRVLGFIWANAGIGMTALEVATSQNKLGQLLYRMPEPEWAQHGKSNLMSAIATCPKELPGQRAEWQYQTAVLMLTRHAGIADKVPDGEEEEIYNMLVECFNNKDALPATRLRAATTACDLRIKQSEKPTTWAKDAYKIASEAISLFSELSLQSLSPKDLQACVQRFSGFSSTAAAVALEANIDQPGRALEVLEQSRDIIASQRFDTRTDLTELRVAEPLLALSFEKYREMLDPCGMDARRDFSQGDRTGSWQLLKVRDTSGKIARASNALKDVIEAIRRCKGFERFLQPPTEKELKEIAHAGAIVVVNITNLRSDALIVTSSGISHVLLSGLTKSTFNGLAVDADMLDKLWKLVGKPVMDHLGYTEDKPTNTPLEQYPRVWWCPTGSASHLPFHAATSRNNKNSVMGRVISSYTSSIKALKFSRSQAAVRKSRGLDSKRGARVVLCGVGDTLHDEEWGIANSLPNAIEEVEDIQEIIEEGLEKAPGASSQYKDPSESGLIIKVLPDPTEDTVRDALCPPPGSKESCYPAVFHFAGHARADPTDPSKSCLYTVDSPFEISEMIELSIYEKAPLMAFLDACQTGVNHSSGPVKLADEGIHLMGAMQMVGFMSVVGSLWKVGDSTSRKVAREVYKKMFDPEYGSSYAEGQPGQSVKDIDQAAMKDYQWEIDGAVARSLHRAVMLLRKPIKEDSKNAADTNPSRWAPFIHMGN